MKKLIFTFISAGIIFASCATVKNMEEANVFETASSARTIEEELEQIEAEERGFVVQEELKQQDIESTIVFVDKPVYVPESKTSPLDKPNLSGKDAVLDSQKRATKKPEQYKNGTFYYQYNENFVYEVYAQPYHLTDIILEPGEILQSPPLLSEDESVWELTAGASIDTKTGQKVQRFFIKPAYSKLDSTLVIITDRRTYHFRLLSFSDTYMAMVKFTYPEEKNTWVKKQDETEGREIVNDFLHITNPEFLSFDYKIKYSRFKKPEFLPKRIYDDGKSTYIQVDDIVLQKKLPILFNEKNEIVNYSVHKNVFVVPRLINKLTLRLGKEKVIIEKKKTKVSKEVSID